MAVSILFGQDVFTTKHYSEGGSRDGRNKDNTREIELTEEQVRLLEKANPCFRERHVESPYPGSLLSQDKIPRSTHSFVRGIHRMEVQRSLQKNNCTPYRCDPSKKQIRIDIAVLRPSVIVNRIEDAKAPAGNPGNIKLIILSSATP